MRITLGLLVILLMIGCSGKDKIPSGIIPREQMGAILGDMIQADQYASIYLVRDSNRINVKLETMKLYQTIFQLHNVSREDFSKSYQFYLERPDLTRTMFDSLLAEGNRTRTESYKNPVHLIPQQPIIPSPAGHPIIPVTRTGSVPANRFKPGVVNPNVRPAGVPPNGQARPNGLTRPPGQAKPPGQSNAAENKPAKIQ